MNRFLSRWTALVVMLLGVPALADDEASRLEQQCAGAIERANGLLKKIQEGEATYEQALRDLDEIQALVDRFAAVDPRGAAPMKTELASIRFWVNKMKPLFGPGELGTKKDPAPGPRPEPRPSPGPRPVPKHDAPAEPVWHVPILPREPNDRATLLAALLKAEDTRNRSWAAVRVPDSPRSNLVERLYELVLGDPDEGVRSAARDGLLRTQHKSVLDRIDEAVGKAGEDRLDVLFEILKDRPDPRSVKALFKIILEHEDLLPNANERSKSAMEEFHGEIKSAFESGWRKRVFDVFQEWPASAVVEGVGRYVVESRDPRARQEALLTLGLYGDGRAATLAVPFLTQDDNPLRATALATVEMIGKPAVPYLAQGLERTSTRLWCYQALINITETQLGLQPNYWIQWWRENR